MDGAPTAWKKLQASVKVLRVMIVYILDIFRVMKYLRDILAKVIGTLIWPVVEDISSPDVSLADADSTSADGKSYIDLSVWLGDGKLDLGEGVSKWICFNNLKHRRFSCSITIRGVDIDGNE